MYLKIYLLQKAFYLQAFSAKTDAVESKGKSDGVNSEAKALAEDVKNTLKVSLDGIKKRVEELKTLRNKIQGRIDVVKIDFMTFDEEKEVGMGFNVCYEIILFVF